MAKRKVFGISQDLREGISQTINAAKNNAGQLRYEVIPLSKISFDPENPRKLAIETSELLDESNLSSADPLFERKKKELESLKSLANSIRKSGVRNAVEVYKEGVNYRLISGERRVLASILAGKEDVQARIIENKPSEFDIRYLQWIENIEREDLSIWERLSNVKQLISAYSHQNQVNVTATILKEILGCSLPHAMTYLAILQAPADIQTLLQNQTLNNLEKAAFLSKIDEPSLRAKLVKACVENQSSLAGLKKILQDNIKKMRDKTALPRKGQGRAARRVTLGYTEKVTVARELIDLVLAQPQYKTLANDLHPIDWQDCSSVSQAFQVLIKLMERA